MPDLIYWAIVAVCCTSVMRGRVVGGLIGLILVWAWWLIDWGIIFFGR